MGANCKLAGAVQRCSAMPNTPQLRHLGCTCLDLSIIQLFDQLLYLLAKATRRQAGGQAGMRLARSGAMLRLHDVAFAQLGAGSSGGSASRRGFPLSAHMPSCNSRINLVSQRICPFSIAAQPGTNETHDLQEGRGVWGQIMESPDSCSETGRPATAAAAKGTGGALCPSAVAAVATDQLVATHPPARQMPPTQPSHLPW